MGCRKTVGLYWASCLCLVLWSCASPELECTYGDPIERRLALRPNEHPIGATATSLVLKDADDAVRFVTAGAVSGPFTIRGENAFVPLGLVVEDGASEPRLVNSSGHTINKYPLRLNCTPLTLGAELTVCSNAFALARLNGDKLDNLISAEGRFEPQFDGFQLCVATSLVDRMRHTFPPTLKRSMTYCGAVAKNDVSFDAEWGAETEVLLSGGRTFLATSTDGGVLVADADSALGALFETGTEFHANSCRIWAQNRTGLFWLDPRSLEVRRAGNPFEAGTHLWSANLSGAQLSEGDELRIVEIEQ